MKSQTTLSFWQHYRALPPEIRQRARQAYKLWRDNPAHPGLFFKRVKESQPVYSVRIGVGYRALGLLKGDTVTWFWIGTHDEYERLLK
ncbi:MAG: hypothetical protein J7463_08105 [Roseiflexus sp.]|jgi:hypothetical protein|nr:hypothetical protein [Roseiflexus sp.]MBO9335263.1 hypothetical protein [Roseiflexus sp.]MBO9365652.1 hypothetical protein [Roseiflexus sp.]MBO9383436.1 hypothetical protein [Roseiflexus sp.]MBO9389279.1 hypothetical protein [Roseiflexus sp.]